MYFESSIRNIYYIPNKFRQQTPDLFITLEDS